MHALDRKNLKWVVDKKIQNVIILLGFMKNACSLSLSLSLSKFEMGSGYKRYKNYSVRVYETCLLSLYLSRSQHEKYASTVMGLPAVARTYFARGRKRRWEEKAAILLLIIIVTTAVSSSCTFLKCCYSAAASTGEETRRRRRIMTETVVIKRRNNNTNDSCRHRNK
jgi:hypothetical protein